MSLLSSGTSVLPGGPLYAAAAAAAAVDADTVAAKAPRGRKKAAKTALAAVDVATAPAAATGTSGAAAVLGEDPEEAMASGGGTAMRLVIVESPAKARTIQRLLSESGSDYIVDSCAGHVRDLPASATQVPAALKKEKWAALGINVDDGFEPLYVLMPGKKAVVDRLKKEAAEASEIILATDEDREGEAISWHLLQLLKPKVPVRRAVFHEITASAVAAAFESPREIDFNLVQAQEARRMVDRLAGYTMSPLLWRKISPGLSAGRVQSVGMAMAVRRERARLSFCSAEYWDMTATLAAAADDGRAVPFDARLVEVNGTSVAASRDFDPDTGALKVTEGAAAAPIAWLVEDTATALARRLAEPGVEWRVTAVEAKRQQRKPPAPFITSTLQQECFNRLRLGAKQCMNIAQALYEEGLITYMRTDNPTLSNEARGIAKAVAEERFGKEHVAADGGGRGKAPNSSQEAHEAIRPAATDGTFKAPKQTGLDGPALEVYELVYARTMASVMAPAVFDQTSATLLASISAAETAPTDEAEPPLAAFRASGRRLISPGFLKAYADEDEENGAAKASAVSMQEAIDAAMELGTPAKVAAAAKKAAANTAELPALTAGQLLDCRRVEPVPHKTLPPARYTEASFVKELEACGVGRPSTYAPILETLKERGYVTAAKGALVPTLTAFVVTDLLSKYFPAFVDTAFTAGMEARLDDIAVGAARRNDYLADYYLGSEGLRQRVADTEQAIPAEEARRARLPALASLDESIGVFVGPYGPYIQQLTPKEAETTVSEGEAASPEIFDEADNAKVSAAAAAAAAAAAQEAANVAAAAAAEPPPKKRGRPAAKAAAAGDAADAPEKPAAAAVIKAPLPRDVQYDVEGLTAEIVMHCLDMSEAGGRLLGEKPGTGQEVVLKIGRYGPYVELRSPPANAWEAAAAAADFTRVEREGAEEAAATSAAAAPASAVEKRVAVPKFDDPTELTLERALGLLSLPRVVCIEPETGESVIAGIGRFGPFVQFRDSYKSVPAGEDVVTMTPERALELAEALKALPPKITLGEYKGKPIRVVTGRWGPYLKWANLNLRIPAEHKADPTGMTLEEAIAVVEGDKGSKGKKDSKAKKEPAKAKKGSKTAATAAADPEDGAAEGSAARGRPQKTRRKAAAATADSAEAAAAAAIKRPRTPYILFCSAKRPEVAEQVSGREVMRELGKLWEATTPEDRTAWEAAAARDKQRYIEEMASSASAG